MGQEESTGGPPSDFSDTRFTTENQPQYETTYTDIYSRQNFSHRISFESYMKKSKIPESDQFIVDDFYVEVLKNCNKKILETSSNQNNKIATNEDSNHSQLSKYEIEKLDHETNEIYSYTLPGRNADINKLKDLIKIKQKTNISKSNHDEKNIFFSPDCSVFETS